MITAGIPNEARDSSRAWLLVGLEPCRGGGVCVGGGGGALRAGMHVALLVCNGPLNPVPITKRPPQPSTDNKTAPST